MRRKAIIVDFLNIPDQVKFTNQYVSKKTFRSARKKMQNVVVLNVLDKDANVYLNTHESITSYLLEN